MTRVVVHAAASIAWQCAYRPKIVEGLLAAGFTVAVQPRDIVDDLEDVHVALGPNAWRNVLRCVPKRNLITVNRCFFGDPTTHVAIGWGGFNGHAVFPTAPALRPVPLLLHDPVPAGQGALLLGEYNVPPPVNLIPLCDSYRPHPQVTYPRPQGLALEFRETRPYSYVCVYGGTTAVVPWVLRGSRVICCSEASVARWAGPAVRVPLSNDATDVDFIEQRAQWVARLQSAQFNLRDLSLPAVYENLFEVRPDDDTLEPAAAPTQRP